MSGPRRLVLLGSVAVIAAAPLTAALLLSGGHSERHYGGLPSWLPKPTKSSSAPVAQASLAHPFLSAIEGEAVSVQLPSGYVLVNVVGPSIPEGVAEKVEKAGDAGTDTVPATFSVTFSSSSGVVPVKVSDFIILGERGEQYRLKVTNAAGGSVPRRVSPGHSLTLQMEAKLPEGEGALRWNPEGPKVVAGWVYGLELD